MEENSAPTVRRSTCPTRAICGPICMADHRRRPTLPPIRSRSSTNGSWRSRIMIKFRSLIVSTVAAAGFGAVSLVAAIAMQGTEPAATDLALLAGVIQLVQRDYVHPVGSHELTRDALKGMLSRLDPHSDYMDAQEFEQSQ